MVVLVVAVSLSTGTALAQGNVNVPVGVDCGDVFLYAPCGLLRFHASGIKRQHFGTSGYWSVSVLR